VGLFPPGFLPEGGFVIGHVGRMHAVKNQLDLVRAYIRLLDMSPTARERARLVVVGDGPLVAACLELLRAARTDHLAWFPGERADVAELMRVMDLFVLPSLTEGISNTILEAMASGLPVVATRVGGTPELVDDDHTGLLVPPSDTAALAAALMRYVEDPEAAARHGRASREKVQARFTWDSMVAGYMAVYDRLLQRQPAPVALPRL
jgi:glycosyltransferase involved in cell wall biosynthesis